MKPRTDTDGIPIYTRTEFSRSTGLSLETLRRYEREERLVPCVYLHGRRYYTQAQLVVVNRNKERLVWKHTKESFE